MAPDRSSGIALWTWLARLAAVYLCAGLFGWLFSKLAIPLPWMIGPLVGTAALFLTGRLTLTIPTKTRSVGQMVVATQVGLAFSPEAFRILINLAPLMVGLAMTTALSGLLAAVLLMRISGQALAPSILACLPMSPVESAMISERMGYDPVPVIVGQTVRIAGVVILIPISLYLIDGWPDRSSSVMSGTEVHLAGFALSALIAVGAALFFRRARLPNPFFFGPLTASAALAASGLSPHLVPPELLIVAQLILGTWLGSTFRREVFLSAGPLVAGSILSSLALIGLSAGFAGVFSHFTALHWEALVLGAAPGGVTEMALTARFLAEDVALVTAFQLVRIFLILPNIPWIVGAVHRWETRR